MIIYEKIFFKSIDKKGYWVYNGAIKEEEEQKMRYTVSMMWCDGTEWEEEAPNFEEAKTVFLLHLKDPDVLKCVVSAWTSVFATLILYYDKRELDC